MGVEVKEEVVEAEDIVDEDEVVVGGRDEVEELEVGAAAGSQVGTRSTIAQH